MKNNIQLQIIGAFVILIFFSSLGNCLPQTITGDWQCKGIVFVKDSITSLPRFAGCEEGLFLISGKHESKIHLGFTHIALNMLGISLFFSLISSILIKKFNEL